MITNDNHNKKCYYTAFTCMLESDFGTKFDNIEVEPISQFVITFLWSVIKLLEQVQGRWKADEREETSG